MSVTFFAECCISCTRQIADLPSDFISSSVYMVPLNKGVVCRLLDRMHSVNFGHSTNSWFPIHVQKAFMDAGGSSRDGNPRKGKKASSKLHGQDEGAKRRVRGSQT